MRQDQLDGLVTFVAVAETRGFSAAAVRLGVSPSAVSQAHRGGREAAGLGHGHESDESVELVLAHGGFRLILKKSFKVLRRLGGLSKPCGARTVGSSLLPSLSKDIA